MTGMLSEVGGFITGAAAATLVASGAIGFVVGSFLDKWLSRERPEIAITQIEVTNDDVGHVWLSPEVVSLAGRSGWSATLEPNEARSTISTAAQRLKTFISWASGDQGINALKHNIEMISSRELSRDELVELVGSLIDNAPVGKTILGMARVGKLSLPDPGPSDQVLTVRLRREKPGALFELDLPARTLGMVVPGATDDETFAQLKKLAEVLRRVDTRVLRSLLPQILVDVEKEFSIAEELAAGLDRALKETEGMPVAAIRISICASNSGDRLAVLAPTAHLDIGVHSRRTAPYVSRCVTSWTREVVQHQPDRWRMASYWQVQTSLHRSERRPSEVEHETSLPSSHRQPRVSTLYPTLPYRCRGSSKSGKRHVDWSPNARTLYIGGHVPRFR